MNLDRSRSGRLAQDAPPSADPLTGRQGRNHCVRNQAAVGFSPGGDMHLPDTATILQRGPPDLRQFRQVHATPYPFTSERTASAWIEPPQRARKAFLVYFALRIPRAAKAKSQRHHHAGTYPSCASGALDRREHAPAEKQESCTIKQQSGIMLPDGYQNCEDATEEHRR